MLKFVLSLIPGWGWLVFGGIALATVTGWHFHRIHLAKQEVRAEWQAERDTLRLAADRERLRQMEANHGIGIDYRKRAIASAAAASAAQSDADSLRAYLTSRTETPTAGQGTNESTATARAFGECVGEYQTLAKTTDRLTDQVTGLQSYVRNVCSAE